MSEVKASLSKKILRLARKQDDRTKLSIRLSPRVSAGKKLGTGICNIIIPIPVNLSFSVPGYIPLKDEPFKNPHKGSYSLNGGILTIKDEKVCVVYSEDISDRLYRQIDVQKFHGEIR